MSKQTSLHPLKAKVFAKGQALREVRPAMDVLIDLKTKIEGIAVEANMEATELWGWLVDQLEINHVPEDDFAPLEDEGSEEEEGEVPVE